MPFTITCLIDRLTEREKKIEKESEKRKRKNGGVGINGCVVWVLFLFYLFKVIKQESKQRRLKNRLYSTKRYFQMLAWSLRAASLVNKRLSLFIFVFKKTIL